MKGILTFLGTIILASATLSLAATSQQDEPLRREPTRGKQPQPVALKGVPDWLKDHKFKQRGFTFVRIKYDSVGLPGRRSSSWATDFPDADLNLAAQVGHLTRLDCSEPSRVLRSTDPELKKYPFAYLTEPGTNALDEAEVVALREYLLGGGFLMIDDSWGKDQWEHLRATMKRIFPDREPEDLPLTHPLFHCVFDLKERPQVVSITSFMSGDVPRLAEAQPPQYWGISDRLGRLMVLICHNTDLGDGWERVGEDEAFTREMSQAKAFPMGINVVFYALTRMPGK
jgi:hypothetical protein